MWVMNKMQNFTKTLAGKLFMYFFITIIIPCSILGFLFYNQLNRNTMSMFLEQRRELMLQMKDNINIYLTYMDRTSESASYDKGVNDYLSMDIEKDKDKWIPTQNSLVNFFKVSTSFSENILQIYIVRNDGRYFALNSELAISDVKKEKEKWSNIAGGKKAFRIIDGDNVKRFNTNSGKEVPVISYVKEVIDYNTLSSIGYIVVDLDFSVVNHIYEKLNFEEDKAFYIVDKDGNLITQSQSDQLAVDQDEIINMLNSEGNILERKEGKTEYVIMKEPLKLGDFFLISVFSKSEGILNQINNSKTYLWIIVGIIFIFALNVSSVLSINISKPIQRLIKNMKLAEKGHFDQECEVTGSQEIVELSSIYNSMIRQIKELISDIKKKEQAKKEVELNALQAQINPHFIYNTLSTVKWMAIIQNNNSIVTILNAFINIMEYSANFKQNLITLEQEKNFIEKYIIIQQARYSGRVNFDIQITPEALEYKILKFIIEPLLENALFHGLENTESKGEIKLKIDISGEGLIIMVTDNGVGIDEDKLQELRLGLESMENRGLNNIGLSNINDRIIANYGDKFGIDIFSKKGIGTTVKVLVPLICDNV